MSKMMTTFARDVPECAVRMVSAHERDHSSRWAAVVFITEKIKRKRAGVQTEEGANLTF